MGYKNVVLGSFSSFEFIFWPFLGHSKSSQDILGFKDGHVQDHWLPFQRFFSKTPLHDNTARFWTRNRPGDTLDNTGCNRDMMEYDHVQHDLGGTDNFEPGNAPNTSAFEKFGQSDVIPGLVGNNSTANPARGGIASGLSQWNPQNNDW